MPKKLPHAHKVYGAPGVNLYAETDVRAIFERVKKRQAAEAKAKEEAAKAIAEEQAVKVAPLKRVAK